MNYILHTSDEGPADARTHRFELMLIRLLHLLAHHPDFAATEESLPEQAKCVERISLSLNGIAHLRFRYIDFFIELVANADNASLLYHLAVQCKTVYDNDGTTYSQVGWLCKEQESRLT